MIPTARTGIVTGETNRQYHANRALSHSGLEDFRRRPAYYKRKHIDEVIKVTTSAAFTLGTAFHTAVLEPELFNDTYVEQPATIKRRAGKEWEAFKAEYDGREVLKADDMAKLDSMQAAVAGNSLAAALLDGCTHKETTFRTGETQFNVALQCRPDGYSATGADVSAGVPYNIDLKSTADMDKWLKQFHDFGYYRQSPFYRTVQATVNGMTDGQCPEPQRFFYIAVESVEPFGCTVFEADPLSLKIGLDEVMEDLEKMRRCVAENNWPNAPEQATAGLPEWRVSKLLDEEAA